MNDQDKACLRAASRPDGYAMYASVQRTIADRLKALGLVEVDDEGVGAFGRVSITDDGRVKLSGEVV